MTKMFFMFEKNGLFLTLLNIIPKINQYFYVTKYYKIVRYVI